MLIIHSIAEVTFNNSSLSNAIFRDNYALSLRFLVNISLKHKQEREKKQTTFVSVQSTSLDSLLSPRDGDQLG